MNIRETIDLLAADMDACEMISHGECALQRDIEELSEEVALMAELCEADFEVSAASGDYAASANAHFERASAMARLENYREEADDES